jgi:tRNA(Arg) A34 adenosine deaminase TadA
LLHPALDDDKRCSVESTRVATSFELTLPGWASDALAAAPTDPTDLEARMRWVIALARTNFIEDTGGPFAAAVFEEETGRVVSIGVNRVVAGRCSSAHAEVMALSLAQQALGDHDLGGAGLPAHQIVINWAPCAMCCGAICWSGVRSVVIAGSDAEMEALTGFDEGPIHQRWPEELRRRGISVRDGLLRDESIEAFRQFAASGRPVYNARKG